MGKNKDKLPKKPFVSVCTPTYNRRPFIPIMIKCFLHQTYPKDKIEWIIVDDGTDKIEDLVCKIPQVKYFKYDEKMSLGKKRNIMNEKASGDIIVYMDDDDYYPPERIQHAVDRLRDSKALCAGSSALFLYFKHINKMYQFGPYGPNHSTAATFAFKRELLNITRFDEDSCVAEEKNFLKQYTIPFVQLESKKTIVVFSHTHNSFDKKELLNDLPNPFIHDTPVLPHDIVKEPDILKFFMEDIDVLLNNYEPGKPQYKEDVNRQIDKIREDRQQMMEEHMRQQQEYQDTINKITLLTNPQVYQQKIDEQSAMIQQLTNENEQLKKHIEYLNGKIKELITIQIQNRNNKG
jgi:glycosyltransferase involved in cell wall biosynthesis